MNTATTGNEGCQCINQTSLLSSLQKRDCITPSGEPGVYLTLGGSCVPYNYGSTYCLQHDLLHDPICNYDASTTVIIPPYCFESWCYVDAKTCKRDSEEAIYKTKFFVSDGTDLFYSYSTCNSTDSFSNTDAATGNVQVVGGLSISADIPTYQFPMLNKQLDDGTLLYKRDGDVRYFNDSIPFGGLYVDYLNTIKDLSNGDIQNVTYTHTSKASLKMYPTSSFTAAVQDVENGLVDMALGPFWITGQRLKMTTFTVPLVYDKTVLVIPKPGQKKSLGYEVQKVLEPFTYSLWGCAIAITVVAALLSVWFSDRELLAKKRYGKSLRQKKQPKKRHKGAYLRLVADAILEKGMFFFSAGIEQDQGASLPHKILMFGFGFFILIAVSAYVANLAAFLTQTGLENTSYGSMKQVSEAGIAICGHPALEAEIRLKWPDANWLFPDGGFDGPDGMFEAYASGDCNVLAVGVEDTILNVETLAKICENNLVYTDSVVTENPIAFPVKPELASALSYWMYLGEKIYGVNLETIKEQYIEENGNPGTCTVKLSDIDGLEEVDDFTRVSPSNMFLPIMLFVFCAFVGIMLQLVHERKRMLGKTSSIGRKSTLAIFENVKKENRSPEKLDDDDWGEVMPRARDIVRRRTTADSNDAASTRSVQFSQDFPGIKIPIDSFDENGGGGGGDVAPQSPHGPTSIFRGSIDDMAKEYDPDAHNAEEDNEMNHRIEQLVESGVIEEVLDCFDFFQEMKKLKKS